MGLPLSEILGQFRDSGFPGGCQDEDEFLKLLQQLNFIRRAPPSSSSDDDESGGEPVLQSADLEGLARYIEEKKPRHVICMVGAGLSTAAGIPDFRSPGTGLYDNLQKYNLPRPEAIFDLDFFRESPDAFYSLARELWPTGKKYLPTLSHFFIKMLHDQGRLLRCYTQNIDMLEQLTGLREDKIIAAHGNFSRAHSLGGQEVPVKELEAAVFAGVGACRALEQKYGSLVKPDIVFFGESLPESFHKGMRMDFPKCDLLLVIGTSLAVAPFNQLILQVPPTCPRVLVNMEPVAIARHVKESLEPFKSVSRMRGGFNFASPMARDVFLEGDCDTSIRKLCSRLGCVDALDRLCPRPSSVNACLARGDALPRPRSPEKSPSATPDLRKGSTLRPSQDPKSKRNLRKRSRSTSADTSTRTPSPIDERHRSKGLTRCAKRKRHSSLSQAPRIAQKRRRLADLRLSRPRSLRYFSRDFARLRSRRRRRESRDAPRRRRRPVCSSRSRWRERRRSRHDPTLKFGHLVAAVVPRRVHAH